MPLPLRALPAPSTEVAREISLLGNPKPLLLKSGQKVEVGSLRGMGMKGHGEEKQGEKWSW